VKPLLLAAAAALALPASAGAAIVPQQSIAGAKLGMTKAQVKAKLGPPQSVQSGTNDFGAFTTFRYPPVSVTFQSGPNATAVVTRSPGQRTAKGVGVGSSVFSVLVGVPGVKCQNESGFVHCFLGAFTPGHLVTDFVIRNARVTRVTIGRVID
jgi:hypothetical protein